MAKLPTCSDDNVRRKHCSSHAQNNFPSLPKDSRHRFRFSVPTIFENPSPHNISALFSFTPEWKWLYPYWIARIISVAGDRWEIAFLKGMDRDGESTLCPRDPFSFPARSLRIPPFTLSFRLTRNITGIDRTRRVLWLRWLAKHERFINEWMDVILKDYILHETSLKRHTINNHKNGTVVKIERKCKIFFK